MPRAPSIGLTVAASRLISSPTFSLQRNAGAVAKLLQCLLHGVVDKNVGAAVAQQRERDFRAAAVGRNRKQQRSALHERLKLVPAFCERRVVAAVGAIHQRRACRRRRIVGVEHRFRGKVAGVKKTVADGEAQPDAARRVTVAAGLDRDAEHVAAAADRQRPTGDAVGQRAQNDLGGIDRRIAEFRQQRQPADMVPVAVAEHQRVDRADIVDVRQQPRRRALAEIEHQPFACHFEQEAGRPLGADAGDQVQQSGFWAHRIRPIFQCSMGGGEQLTMAGRVLNQPL